MGALLCAVHPLHVEAVAYISALPDVGSGFFYLLAFWLFLRVEKAGKKHMLHHCLAALAYLPALLFKEMALSFPLVLLAYGFFGKKQSWISRAARLAPYVTALGPYVGTRTTVLGRFSLVRDFWNVRLQMPAAGIGLLGQHAKLFFWPASLNMFHELDLKSSLYSPWPWVAIVVVVGGTFLRWREPVSGFLVIWWAVTLIPCLDIRQLSYPLLAERFSYLPSVGLCLAIAFVLLSVFSRWSPRLENTPAIVLGVAAVLLVWAVQTIRMIPHWHDNENFWAYSARVAPNAGLVHLDLAEVYLSQSDMDGAANEYKIALRLNNATFRPLPGVNFDSYIGLGRIAHKKN